MPKFYYKAKTGPKDFVEGIIEAESENGAIRKVTDMGYFPLLVKREDISKNKSLGPLSFFNRAKLSDVSVFTRQLSDLLGAGLPLVKALDVLTKQTENKNLASIVNQMRDFVRDGNTLSEAMSKHPEVFSNLFVSMIRSGETGGALEGVLARLAEFSEKQLELQTKVKSAMAYPALMAFVGLATIFVLLTFVIPRIVVMFQDLGQSLPIPTMILVAISMFFKKFWYLALSGILIIYFIGNRAIKTKEGRLAFDNFKLKVPIFGELTKRTEISRFARTLSTLLSNGVPMIEALDVVSNTLTNDVLRNDVRTALKEVQTGSTLTDGLSKGKNFPLFVINMIAVGEEGGLLESSLAKVADSYEKQVDKTIRVMTSLLEPLLILSLGLVVGFIVVSMLLPIFQINFMAR